MTQESAAELRAARERLRRRIDFPPELEARYREAQNRRYRVPRTILFLTAAAAFGLAPLYSQALFQPQPSIVPLMLALQLGLAFPLLLLGLLATVRDWPERLRQPVHTASVMGMWVCVLCHHLFAQQGLLTYPSEMIGVSVTAVAVFGGYRTRRFVIGGTLTLGLGLLISWHFRDGDAVAATGIYSTVFIWLVAIAGAISLDLLSRNAWISQRYAQALARTDPVTGLMSRGMFDETFLKTLAAARRAGVTVGAALIDLDHFKSVNDRFGHDKGDEVLAAFAEVLRDTAARRPLDLCARYGGEEFVVVWVGVDAATVQQLVDQLLAAIRRMRYEAGLPPESQRLTASIGATWFQPTGEDERRAVIKAADELLYRAKNAGRDRAALAPFIPASGMPSPPAGR